MFIRELEIKNYRSFDDFSLKNIAVPDNTNLGSGLNVILGENGCGKTSILDAIALALGSYKVDSFSFHDLHKADSRATITAKADTDFTAKKLYSGDFQANGLCFKGYLREKSGGSLDRMVVTQSLLLSDEIEEGKPDLRADLKGTYGEARYNQEYQIIDVYFRIGSIVSGVSNKTEFDRTLEHLNYHYVRDVDDKSDVNGTIKGELAKVNKSTVLSSSVKRFNELMNLKVELRHVDNSELFSRSFLAQKIDENNYVSIDRMGKGYQLLLALLVKKEVAKTKKHDLIVMIDEAEMHLHPSLQQILVQEIMELSKSVQVFITSHSPIFVHELFLADAIGNTKKHLLKKGADGGVVNVDIEEAFLPRATPAEINYLAFNYSTLEYHNELYGQLSYLKNISSPSKLDKKLGVGEDEKLEWKRDNGCVEKLSIHSILRNSFHHKENQENDYCTDEFIMNNLQESIEFLRERIREERKEPESGNV